MAQPPQLVRVCAPELVSDGLASSHHTYLVELTGDGVICGSARRRFSDFDLLERTLKLRYVGLVLPPLPPKSGLSLQAHSAEFLQQRARGLARFAVRVARVPTLLRDILVAAFFGLGGADAWEVAVKKARAAPSFSQANNPGLDGWLARGGAVVLPDDETLDSGLTIKYCRSLYFSISPLTGLGKDKEPETKKTKDAAAARLPRTCSPSS